MLANTDWFRDAKWGVFCHYLSDGFPGQGQDHALTTKLWNKQVDSFDVDALADQLASINVPYIFITLGQNSGFFCTPNKTYDSIVGIKPSKLSKRDLVADLYEALNKKNIDLLVYLPAGAPDRDEAAMKALDWENGSYPDYAHPNGIPADATSDKRLADFQRKWESIIAEWSNRWGKKVKGWWFDGCYFAKAMYRHADEPNFKSFAAAAKAGNPDSIVAFNPGVTTPVIRYSEYEDYTAGEVSNALPVWDNYSEAGKGRFVDGAQYHILTFLGRGWAASPPRFSRDLVAGYTKFINDHQGVITWDVPINKDGSIPDEFIKTLAAINKK